MIVTSNKTISFPKFGWGIHAGEERELPESKDAMEAILEHPAISEVEKSQTASTSKSKEVKDDKKDEEKSEE